MTEEARKLLQQALLLGPKERAQIAARLVDSINSLAAAETAWNMLIEVRARRALSKEVGQVHYLGGAPVPLRFDVDAELDVERAVTAYLDQPGQSEAFLDELSQAVERVRAAPSRFGAHPGMPPELGIRRTLLREFPHALVFVPTSKELRILAVAHSLTPPEPTDVSVEALISVEDWLVAHGARAVGFLVAGAAVGSLLPH